MFDFLNYPGCTICFFLAVVFLLFLAFSDFPLCVIWGILVFLSLLALIAGCLWLPEYFTGVCSACGDVRQNGDFCTSCGQALVEQCMCGHLWSDSQFFCPDCGRGR